MLNKFCDGKQMGRKVVPLDAKRLYVKHLVVTLTDFFKNALFVRSYISIQSKSFVFSIYYFPFLYLPSLCCRSEIPFGAKCECKTVRDCECAITFPMHKYRDVFLNKKLIEEASKNNSNKQDDVLVIKQQKEYAKQLEGIGQGFEEASLEICQNDYCDEMGNLSPLNQLLAVSTHKAM